jgi:uncharacterized protein with NRDE domain
MCLILFSFKTHPRYKLVLAANRDEFFERPTLLADFWESDTNILGGIDIISGGTWLGVTTTGRFAAITNYRNPLALVTQPISRGKITRQFLQGESKTEDFLAEISMDKDHYNGFNVLLSDDGFETLHHYSNITNKLTVVSQGVHGLSNALLDTSWPKVDHGISKLSQRIGESNFQLEDIISIMTDKNIAQEDSLPRTGISLELERKLSPVFISMKGYGTRCTTAIRLDYDNNLEFLEVSYDESSYPTSSKQFNIQLNGDIKN